MYGIRQEELFSFEQLMDMQPELKYAEILDPLPISAILHAIGKKSAFGRPERNNTRAMIYSLIIGKLERMPFVKDIIHRLKTSAEFRLLCRFTGSDRVPSRASYSRLITKLHQCGVLGDVQDQLVSQSISEGFISGETLAMDSTHLHAWDRNPALEKRKPEEKVDNEPTLLPNEPTPAPLEKPKKPVKPKREKKSKPIPKEELDAWREQMEVYESSLPLLERKVEAMLPLSYEELVAQIPQHPKTGAKGDPRRGGRLMFWYGYKGNVLVDTQSQFIVKSYLCSGHVSDQRLGIVLLKGMKSKFPMLPVKQVLADKGFDSLPVYQQVRRVGAFALIPIIRHAKKPPEGMDEHFRPVCKQGHAYQYDSFDAKYETLKYTRPKACKECPLQGDECQKVYKIAIAQDIRRHTVPARGSAKYDELFKRRTAVERVFAYLKLYFGLGKSRLSQAKARVDFDLSCLVYNLCKYAVAKLNKEMESAMKAS
ncbi:Transposase DDE domain protein [compost metagenome]